MGRTFDLAAFCAQVHAVPQEVNVLRHAVVRGLKDYYETTYGYDRYGAETLFLVPERMTEPYIFGFACRRIVRDRRISQRTKVATSELALDMVRYGTAGGVPYAFFELLTFLAGAGRLPVHDLRYALVVTAGETAPLQGVSRITSLAFMTHLISREDMPAGERLLWQHSLISRKEDGPGVVELINAVMQDERNPIEGRLELARAWLHFRQPRFEIPVLPSRGGLRDEFVREHLPFWVAHSPSWPTPAMVRSALVWLARLTPDAAALAQEYSEYSGTFADEIGTALVQIVAEHHTDMPQTTVRDVIERGISVAGSNAVRRKFYELGIVLFGSGYLERASCDPSNSVRQWAARQKLKQV